MNVLTRVEKAIQHTWWVILFAFLCLGLLEHALKQRDITYATLEVQRSDLEVAKKKALTTKQELLLRLNSESDPAWIELLLMYGLGVVPDEQTKVFFKK